MRKLFLYLLLWITLFFLTGCDWGLEIVSIKIESLPNKLVYIAEEDTELDLSGGTISVLVKDGNRFIEKMDNDLYYEVTSDVKFNEPGIYTVTVTRLETFSAHFTIEVVDKN